MTDRTLTPLLLAAGRGRRLRPFTDHSPKCMIEVGGKSLLVRHLEAFAALGLTEAAIVVGYEHQQIRRLGREYAGVKIRYVFNEQFERGSILSLRVGLSEIAQGGIVMDADVLYERAVLERLVEAPFDCGFLLDETAEETGEEMMLGARDGRVLAIDRRVGDGWDAAGEGVGFFKIGPNAVQTLKANIDQLVALGRDDVEYEVALNALIQRVPAGYVQVGDLAWTEIDFAHDLDRAQKLLARIDRG